MIESIAIRLLPDHVINKIAAGEVVERPASVLKELMENAIDAGATRIEVSVVGGGKRALVVTDNGSGMSRDDALLSVERHATSKIRDVEDIEQIGTMGFRGEALAAIASVSRFGLITRRADRESGTEVTLAAGRVLSVDDAGCPPGTTITVRSLFFNVPARRKFLRTEQTEFAHVKQMFLVHALAHPDLALHLRADDRPIYELPSGASLKERIRDVFNADLMQSLVPIDYADVEARISGFAGLPRTHRADRSEQYIFVNGRPASAPVVGHAVREAYHTLIPRGRSPVLFLFIETDPGQVDVNVHPTKKEIRFRRSREIRDAVMSAIHHALHPAPEGAGQPRAGPGYAASPSAPEPLVQSSRTCRCWRRSPIRNGRWPNQKAVRIRRTYTPPPPRLCPRKIFPAIRMLPGPGAGFLAKWVGCTWCSKPTKEWCYWIRKPHMSGCCSSSSCSKCWLTRCRPRACWFRRQWSCHRLNPFACKTTSPAHGHGFRAVRIWW